MSAHSHGHTGHGHTHDLPDHRGRLAAVLAITLTVLVAEVVGAVVSGSLALLTDAAHVLTDAGGLVLGLVAASLARRPTTDTHSWGWRRAEVLGAAAQAAVLLGVGLYVLVESVSRLLSPEPVASGAMLVFGAVGLVGNLVGLGLLVGARGADLNLRAAFLEVANDTLGSVAVLVAAAVVALTGWARADAVASLVIVALILPRTLLLLASTGRVLLEATPAGIDVAALRGRLCTHPHVLAVHDLHVTQVATGLPTLTAHVVVTDECFLDGHLGPLLDELQALLARDFDVAHSTLQFESERHAEHEHAAHP
ncbi:cation diffusion facilitator family transporter [Nocardioides sp. GY 10127]|uniref:cation diffusion facilitator family transporter n=1 Tax=Nocardioides sp. GY 10127 TaxID=2569762 RepID=UPI0010A7842D|nr:cation diffusion facilitator family transporter [Nocardioides sp. GY 10127]TIC81785.1 cation transporter [Nocardioides sp. GY 10127]